MMRNNDKSTGQKESMSQGVQTTFITPLQS